MNNQAIGWGIGALVIIGGGAFFILGGAPSDSGVEKMNGSMKDLLAANRPLSCTFSFETDGAYSEGNVYIANGKIRSDNVVNVRGQTIENHMIGDGKIGHSWSSLTSQGIKFSMMGSHEDASSSGAPSLDQEISSSCKSWIVDASFFEIPKNISFIDSSAVGASGNAMQCGMCDTVPEAGRAQCRASLGCN